MQCGWDAEDGTWIRRRTRCDWMFQRCEAGGRDQNSGIQPGQDLDLVDQNEVVDG